jgi:hypothetical protein
MAPCLAHRWTADEREVRSALGKQPESRAVRCTADVRPVEDRRRIATSNCSSWSASERPSHSAKDPMRVESCCCQAARSDAMLRYSNGHKMIAPRGEMLSRLAIAAFVTAAVTRSSPATGHDVWSNDTPVPSWIKKACCGPSEVHHLSSDKVHALPDGYHVDGLATVIPYSRVQPSPDGEFWGFWNPHALNPVVFCFFAGIKGI